MSTSILNCVTALSKELGDYWSSTTTAAGSSTSIVDDALKAKANDWITDESWVILTEEPTGSAAIYDERKVSSHSSGSLTVLAFSAAPGIGIDYELHRLFQPSEKRRAILAAIKMVYPALFTEIWDETLVTGNWLKDGSFERWDDANTLTDWTDDGTVILTRTTASPYYKHGVYSCKLGTAAGLIHQDVTNFDDLKHLAGKTVTFTVQGYCAVADTLRIAIYDGTTETLSDYRTAEAAWTKNNEPMRVQATIQDNPTAIEFRIYLVTANDAYVDDARVISDYRSRLYIRHLGLVKDRPHQVLIEPTDYSQEEDWIKITDYKIDKDGYLYIPTTYQSDRRLRIRGIKYLDFVDSSGDSGTDWEDTIDIDDPELKIITAEAAYYLYTWMSMPNYETGTRRDYQEAIAFWAMEKERRKSQYGMKAPPTTIHWGIH